MMDADKKTADEIIRALRCRKAGKRKCARCPYNKEMSCTEAAMDAAADLIESQQAQLAAEHAKYAELQRYNVGCTKKIDALLVEKMDLKERLSDQTARANICEHDAKTWREDRDRLQAQLDASQRETQAAEQDIQFVADGMICDICTHSGEDAGDKDSACWDCTRGNPKFERRDPGAAGEGGQDG